MESSSKCRVWSRTVQVPRRAVFRRVKCGVGSEKFAFTARWYEPSERKYNCFISTKLERILSGTDLDRLDRKILAFLQANGRASNLELAEAVGLSPAQCHRRHRRLEEEGFIARYETRLNPGRVGLNVVAFIHVAMEKGHIRDLSNFTDVVVGLPEILECYSVTGDFDYVVKVIASDLKALSQFLMEKLMRLPSVNGVRSSVCLDEIKCTSSLPLPA